MPREPLILTLDVGTGSVRAGLIDFTGTMQGLAAIAHETFYPRHGWVEQRPEDWWHGAKQAIRSVTADDSVMGRIAAVICCGQMHAPVLVDASGHLVRDRVPLWNDKRAAIAADTYNQSITEEKYPAEANPATSAWPGIKLLWSAREEPETLSRTRWLMMPKDYLNFRLSGEAAMDWTEAGSSFLADADRKIWSPDAAARLSVPAHILPPMIEGTGRLGKVTRRAAAETGLPEGLPVFGGAGDFPAAILGSGVTETGQVSDITGTSFLLTRLGPHPVRHPEVMNVAIATGGWGAFAVVDAGGDAVRWAARTLDRDSRSYEALSHEAATVPPGAGGLVFLPYLTGERLGQGTASRAAFLGLTASHTPAHLHRAVMEGVVVAMREAYAPIIDQTDGPKQIIAAAGGARSDLWLQIKADVFGVPIIATEQAEAGLLGCTALALSGLGIFASPKEAIQATVRYRPPIMPDPGNLSQYAELIAAFRELRRLTPEINRITGRLS
jgi:xylulokinase